MAHLPRYALLGQPQHIIQRGNHQQVIFAADADYQFFRDAMVVAAIKHRLAVHAYVWMTNHVHLLATLALDDSIGRVFQSVGRRYVRYFNVSYGRVGTLWEGRYRGTVVDSEQRSKKAADTVRHDILQGSLVLGREGHFDAEAVPAYVDDLTG